MPAILVGTWSGDSSGETAYTSYTFASDGRFLIRRPGGSITGVAVAQSYRSLNLDIDGYSYVRDV